MLLSQPDSPSNGPATGLAFEKWQALGNDYLIVEASHLRFDLTPARVRKICSGHFGVGADGLLLLSRPQDPRFVADLVIYNPDGSRAELSGNGTREAILYLRHRGWTDQDTFSIRTDAGEIRPTITGPRTCTVDMGRASLTSRDFPGGPPDGRAELTAPAGTQTLTWRFQHVSIGNPQCAIPVAAPGELAALDLPLVGPGIEAHESFPNRTNVSWYAELEPGRIRARIFERGVGETLSSGTGATGAAIAYVLARPQPGGSAAGRAAASGGRGGSAGARADGAAETVTVVLDGGELEVEVGEDLHVNLTGWALPVFSGSLSEDFLKELHETE